MAKEKSALIVLPVYKQQIGDANVIISILTFIILFSNCYLVSNSYSFLTLSFSILAISMSVLSILSYKILFKKLLKTGRADIFFISSLIEYIIIVISILPLLIYLYIEEQWSMIDRYGLKCLYLYNESFNWILPLSVFIFISVSFWMTTSLAFKESHLFYHLEKKKKEIYE